MWALHFLLALIITIIVFISRIWPENEKSNNRIKPKKKKTHKPSYIYWVPTVCHVSQHTYTVSFKSQRTLKWYYFNLHFTRVPCSSEKLNHLPETVQLMNRRLEFKSHLFLPLKDVPLLLYHSLMLWNENLNLGKKHKPSKRNKMFCFPWGLHTTGRIRLCTWTSMKLEAQYCTFHWTSL